jgi:flagellar hook assembly protein FlgD
VDESLPARLALGPNRPNPFVSATRFDYALPASGHVRFSLYDVRGRRVATLVDAVQEAGPHTLRWEGRDAAGGALASGAYFARLEFAGRSQVRKVVLMR